MFRATSYIFTVRTLLYRRHPAHFQIASITRFPPNFKYQNPKERETCPPPKPPPPPPPKDDRLFWGAMALLIVAGGFVVYAKGSPEIRDWLTLNASWMDDIIAVLYQENYTYGEFVNNCIEDTKRYIKTLSGGDNIPKVCPPDGGPLPNYDVPDESRVAELSDEASLTCEPEPPPVVTQDICDIERCMKDLGESALNNYDTAKQACLVYNLLVEDTMQTFSYRGMKRLRHAMEERQKLVKESLNNASNCVNKLDEMVRYLDCGVQASKEQIRNSKFLHRDFHEKFKSAFMEYQWENERSTVMDRQWQLVEEVVQKYVSQNETMYPTLKYSAKVPVLQGDADIMLYNSYRYINQLTDELKVASDAMTDRVNRAIDMLPQGEKCLKAREANLTSAIARKRAELHQEYKQREEDQHARNDMKLRERSKKSLNKHEDSLAQKLAQKEAEMMSKFQSMIDQQVAREKRIFAVQLEEMEYKLKIVEQKLEMRMKAEKETRRSQELWSAGAALLEATKKGDPYVKVDKEIRAIEKASGENDKLVSTVLESIPESVFTHGIVPESVLREGFHAMEKTARNVALVEEEGGPMPVYILSWLQGLLLFMKVSTIPQAEYDKPPLEPPEGLDTFDLLQRASFWMDRGNLANAVRYISSLEGASKAAARKWYDAARAHLEVRQAAEAVLAHAAAMGLQYI